MSARRVENGDPGLPPRLSGPVYDRLKDLILTGRIGPGVKLDEDRLSRQFGVSRTPVREAVSRLVHEGLARQQPRRGAYVTNFTKREILDILKVREVLEGLAARLAAERLDETALQALREVMSPARVQELRTTSPMALSRADQRFHEMVFRSTGNQRLIDIMSQLNDQMQLVRMRTMFLPGRLDPSVQETYDIIDALEKRDPDLAEACARRHIQGARRAVQAFFPDDEFDEREHGGPR